MNEDDLSPETDSRKKNSSGPAMFTEVNFQADYRK